MLSQLTVPLQLRRIRATSNNSRDLPPVNMGHSVDEFFDVLADDSKAGAKLPNWSVVYQSCSNVHSHTQRPRSSAIHSGVASCTWRYVNYDVRVRHQSMVLTFARNSSTVEHTPRMVSHSSRCARRLAKRILSIGSIKKGNRKSEILLRDVEVRATSSVLYGAPGVLIYRSCIRTYTTPLL